MVTNYTSPNAVCTNCGHKFTLHYPTQGDCFYISPFSPYKKCPCIAYTNTVCSICNIIPCACNAALSPDAPTVTNEEGGSQSLLRVRFDLLDTTAMFRLARILDYGERKYGANNWRKIPTQDHINHALTHIFGYLQGDTQDDHLGHAFCRLMFAIGTHSKEEAKSNCQRIGGCLHELIGSKTCCCDDNSCD